MDSEDKVRFIQDQSETKQQIQNLEGIQTLEPSKLLPKQRLICLDVHRGLTMAAMIVVDSMGNYDYLIWPLRESDWDGLTTADCIFPTFLFIMGLAIPLALKRETVSQEVWYKIFKRFALLFIIGVVLNIQLKIPEIFTTTPFTGFRIPGVFQRISICYLATSINYLIFPRFYFHIIFILACFTLYLGFIYGFDVPSIDGAPPCGRGDTGPLCYFGRYLDLKVFSQRFMMDPYDPEGIISTFPSFMNTFIGMCYMLIMKDNTTKQGGNILLLKKWSLFACLLGITGGLIAIGDPVNKKRWSVSFAFVTSAIAGAGLFLSFLLVDILNKPIIKVTGYWKKRSCSAESVFMIPDATSCQLLASSYIFEMYPHILSLDLKPQNPMYHPL